MTALVDIQAALASQIQTGLAAIQNVQVTHLWNPNPTPPSVDIYPGVPFQTPLGMGKANNEIRLSVRCRVSAAANEDAQLLLLSLMDPSGSLSLAQVIAGDRTLGGKVSSLSVEGPGEFTQTLDVGGTESLLGSVWTVRILP